MKLEHNHATFICWLICATSYFRSVGRQRKTWKYDKVTTFLCFRIAGRYILKHFVFILCFRLMFRGARRNHESMKIRQSDHFVVFSFVRLWCAKRIHCWPLKWPLCRTFALCGDRPNTKIRQNGYFFVFTSGAPRSKNTTWHKSALNLYISC
jgi:hypothetical protein